MTGAKVSRGGTIRNFSVETTAMLLSQPSGEMSAGLCLEPCGIASPAQRRYTEEDWNGSV